MKILFMVLFFLAYTIGFSSTPPNKNSEKRTSTVAILPFKNTNHAAADKGLGEAIASMLNTHLRNETNFTVVDRMKLNQVLNEQSLNDLGVTAADREKLQKLFSVEVLLTGEVSYLENFIHIDTRLIDTKTGEVVVAEYSEIKDLNQLREKMVQLSKVIELKYLRQWMGDLVIVTHPVVGEVYLDDQYLGTSGLIKPLVRENLLEGTYRLKVVAGGYQNYVDSIYIQSKSKREIQINLKSLPGALTLLSEPSGAKVFLNKKEMGRTPLKLDTIPEGKYNIVLEMKDYKVCSGFFCKRDL